MTSRTADNELNIFIGIDPGVTGAIAISSFPPPDEYSLDPPKQTLLGVHDYVSSTHIPFLRGLKARGASIKACIENVNIRPFYNIKSGGKMMFNFGEWVGVLKALEIPYNLVAPQTWQAALNLGRNSLSFYKQNFHIPPASKTNTRRRKSSSISSHYCKSQLSADIDTIAAGLEIGGPANVQVSQKELKERKSACVREKNLASKIRKEFHLVSARAMYPSIAGTFLKYKKDHNRADALLILRYCEDLHGARTYAGF